MCGDYRQVVADTDGDTGLVKNSPVTGKNRTSLACAHGNYTLGVATETTIMRRCLTVHHDDAGQDRYTDSRPVVLQPPRGLGKVSPARVLA